MRVVVFPFLIVLLLSAMDATAADRVECRVKAKRQGLFKGSVGAQSEFIPISGVSLQITSPRDAATGLPSGKRQYKPVVLTKEVDGSSPQFFASASTNEVIDSVTCNFVRLNGNGTENVHMVVTLTNALVVDISIAPESKKLLTEATGIPSEMEQVSLTFQKIEIEDLDTKTFFADDWNLIS